MGITARQQELLDYLKDNGYKIGLATSTNAKRVERHLVQSDMKKYFDTVVTGDTVPNGKPAPDIYIRAAEKLGLAPAECLVFEDGTSGIRSANAAGVGGVVALYEKKQKSPLTEQTKVDEVHHDLLSWKQILSDYGILR